MEYLPYKIDDMDFDKFINEFFEDDMATGLNIIKHIRREPLGFMGTYQMSQNLLML